MATSPNTSTTRNTNVSVESPDIASIDTSDSEQKRVDHAANEGAQRASNRINADKTHVPGNSIFTK